MERADETMIDWFDVWWSVYKAGRRALVLFAWAN
jgi:hypothetical protein